MFVCVYIVYVCICICVCILICICICIYVNVYVCIYIYVVYHCWSESRGPMSFMHDYRRIHHCKSNSKKILLDFCEWSGVGFRSEGSTLLLFQWRVFHWNSSRVQPSYRRPPPLCPFRSQQSNSMFILLAWHWWILSQ